jgi:hypothetical protein
MGASILMLPDHQSLPAQEKIAKNTSKSACQAPEALKQFRISNIGLANS